MKLDEQHRKDIGEAAINLANRKPAEAFNLMLVRVLLSIDARLAETNDFYFQNQEERTRPNG